MKTPTLQIRLVRWYLAHGMTDRLAEAVLVCRYLETVLDGIPATHTGRIAPVFDYPIDELRQDWLRCRWFDLWVDGVTGEIVKSLPGADGEPDTQHQHLPIDVQGQILFGRFALIFR